MSELPASSATDRGPRALVRGAGDLASGVAFRLIRAGFSVVMTEIARPTVVRRAVAFAEAVWEGRVEVEGLPGILAQDAVDVHRILRSGAIPVIVDPEAAIRFDFRPDLLVDAIMAKRNLGTHTSDAPAVVALGPGFVAGRDAHAVVETMRGPTLGRVIIEGVALPDTGVPGERGGFAEERVLRSPCAGVFTGLREIGDRVERANPWGWWAGPRSRRAGRQAPWDPTFGNRRRSRLQTGRCRSVRRPGTLLPHLGQGLGGGRRSARGRVRPTGEPPLGISDPRPILGGCVRRREGCYSDAGRLVETGPRPGAPGAGLHA